MSSNDASAPADQADPDDPKIYGAILINNFRAFEEEVGVATVRAAIAGLPDSVAAHYHALVPVAWVPSRIADQIFAAIAAEAGRDLKELFPRVIERGVEKTLASAWRWVLRLVTDRALISRTPRLFEKTYSRGRLDVEMPDPGLARITLTDWPNPPEYRLLAIAAGIRAVLRLTGRKNVRSAFERTPDGAIFQAHWNRT